MDLFRTPPHDARSGKVRHSRFVKRAEPAHRLIPVTRDRQIRHAPNPSGTHTGHLAQDL
jgi:hypothetical protein